MGQTSGFYRAKREVANLEVIKTVDNSSPNVGDNVVFTIVATNSGDFNAENVFVTDILPSGYSFVSAIPNIGTWSNPNWTIGNLSVGASASMELTAVVLPSGIYDNVASIIGLFSVTDVGNNNSICTVTPNSGIIYQAPFVAPYPFPADEIELWDAAGTIMITNVTLGGPGIFVFDETVVLGLINLQLGPSFIPNTTIVGFNFSYTGTQAFQVILKSSGTAQAAFIFT